MSPRRTFTAVLAAALLSAASIVTAQQPVATPPAATTAPPSPNLAGLAHVAIRVHDLDASVAFYQKLGFVRAFALSRDGVVYEAFIKINDQQFLELYPADTKNTQVGFLHVCFYGHDLQSVHDDYIAHGLAPRDVRTAGAGNLLFTMPGPATPTGPQNMEYTQYMPASMHSKASGAVPRRRPHCNRDDRRGNRRKRPRCGDIILHRQGWLRRAGHGPRLEHPAGTAGRSGREPLPHPGGKVRLQGARSSSPSTKAKRPPS
jgi:catechol 2,3-dioxygenase-like lactoylglutathione lyase family enzyme